MVVCEICCQNCISEVFRTLSKIYDRVFYKNSQLSNNANLFWKNSSTRNMFSMVLTLIPNEDIVIEVIIRIWRVSFRFGKKNQKLAKKYFYAILFRKQFLLKKNSKFCFYQIIYNSSNILALTYVETPTFKS